MTIYFSRPISQFNTPQDKRDIETLEAMGFEVVDPNQEHLKERYKVEGMKVFLDLSRSCDAIAFRSFPDAFYGSHHRDLF